MNASDDGDEPVGESPVVGTQAAVERGAVLGILGAADAVLATKQLAERQALALKAVQELHERETTLCINCGEPHPCSTIRAIDEAGA